MKYVYKIIETYEYEIEVDAKNEKEALKEVKHRYETADDGYIGVADAYTLKDTKFELNKKE